MIGILALAALVLVFAGGSSSSSSSPATKACEIWLTVDDRSVAICGSEQHWQLGIDDVIQAHVYKDLSMAASAAIERLGVKAAEHLVVSTPQARTEITRANNNTWAWTVELAGGGAKNGDAGSLLDALGEAYAAGGAV